MRQREQAFLRITVIVARNKSIASMPNRRRASVVVSEPAGLVGELEGPTNDIEERSDGVS